MILRPLLAAAALIATPAFAHGHAPVGHQAGDPVPAGCVRANAHVPAGKIAHAPAPIRCGTAAEIAAREPAPRAARIPPAARN